MLGNSFSLLPDADEGVDEVRSVAEDSPSQISPSPSGSPDAGLLGPSPTWTEDGRKAAAEVLGPSGVTFRDCGP